MPRGLLLTIRTELRFHLGRTRVDTAESATARRFGDFDRIGVVTQVGRAIVSCTVGLAFCAALGAASAGCGGDSAENAGGGDRLHWDQAEASRDRLVRYSFTLYVDGSGATLEGVQCGQQAAAAGYPCSGMLPSLTRGTHTLELQAVVDGRAGPKSAPTTVTVSGGRAVVEGVAPVAEAGRVATSGIAGTTQSCAALPSELCFGVEILASSAVPITSPVVVPDGRVLFIEGGRAVRVSRGAWLLPEPALSAPEPVRLVALAIDPTFRDTRFVWLARVDETAQHGRMLSVSRFRELADRLGEEATIISDLELPAHGDPGLALDAQRRLYVLTPPAIDRQGGRGADDTWRLLRFTLDGAVPWESGQTSPVVAEAEGFSGPFAWDAVGRRLWLASRTVAGRPELRSLVTTDARGGSSDVALVEHPILESGSDEIVAMAVLGAEANAEPSRHLLMAKTSGGLWLGKLDSAGTLNGSVRLSYSGGRPTALASGEAPGVILVEAPSALEAGADTEYRLVRLIPEARRQ